METEQRKTSPWIYVALVIAIILSLGCGLVAGGVGGFILGRNSARRAAATSSFRIIPPQAEPRVTPFATPQQPGRPALPNLQFGAIVRSVTAGSPADEAGIQEGDIIVAVDGQSLTQERDLRSVIRSYQPGDRVELTLLRMGDMMQGRLQRTVQVQLGSQRDEQGATVAYLGVTVSQIPAGMFTEPQD